MECTLRIMTELKRFYRIKRKARISDNILKKIEVAINTGIFYAWTISSV